MSSKALNIKKTFRITGFYIPFTWYFILFAAGVCLGYKWLQNKSQIPDTAYADIFALLLKVAVWFCTAILLFAFITVSISFLFFLWKKKKQEIIFKTDTKSGNNSSAKQTVQLHIHPILKPLLGFIKIRLKYDDENFSGKFSLIEESSKKLISTAIDGIYYWPLPEIKEYKIEKAIIYFEDFFQFFSFAVAVNTSNRFFTQPNENSSKQINISPRKTEDSNTRIEELKKVEGEYLNYKNFETNDDVRRIVWKIYAKNKDLVVRIPEILDPYASHIYLYASFFSMFDVKGNDAVEIPFLNYYKTIIWSVYRQLTQQGFEVRFRPDQDVPQNNLPDTQQLVKYSISTNNWQTEKDLKNYVKLKDAGMVIVSSLSNAEDVKEIVDQYGNDLSFVFVQLTNSLHKQHLGDWLQWIFVQQEKDDIAVYKTNWSLSLLRPKIIQNEKKLKKILEQYQKTVMA